jgi:hypothetical protein
LFVYPSEGVTFGIVGHIKMLTGDELQVLSNVKSCGLMSSTDDLEECHVSTFRVRQF